MTQGARFYAAEMEVYRPGGALVPAFGWATQAHGTPLPVAGPVESTDTVRVSDAGYRDATAGIYPPLLDRAFDIDRDLPLAPGAAAVGGSWGKLRLLNPGGVWDGMAASASSDGRPVRVLTARRGYDAARGIETHPAYAGFTTVFAGIAGAWALTDTALEVPLRDAGYWLERDLQRSVYSGAGGYDGAASLAGIRRPKARGGTISKPIANVTPLLIDPVNRIYAVSDAAAIIVALYEGGAATLGYQGDVTNLYAGTTNPGYWRGDSSRGLFQIGSATQKQLTADVIGNFPGAGAASTAAEIARLLLVEDLGLDAAFIDTAAFAALDAAYPAVSGYFFDGGAVQAWEAVGLFLRGIGAKLVPGRDGKLRPVALRAIPAGTAPVATLTAAQIVDVQPMSLGQPLDPPADRWTIGCQRNATIQTADLLPGADARLAFLAQEFRAASAYSATVNAAYRRPSAPDLVTTALLDVADAQDQADASMALWGVRRTPYAVTVPVEVGLPRDIGDVVRVVFPAGPLRGGALGQVVGEQYRSTEATMTLKVLV